MIFALSGHAQDGKWSFSTRLWGSYYHLGSYAKERPAFSLEELAVYDLSSRWEIIAGLGISAYPGALGLPLFAGIRYYPLIDATGFYADASHGYHLRVSEIFFASHRNQVMIGYQFQRDKFDWAVGTGANLLWDRYGGGALSFVIDLSIRFHKNREH